MNIQNKIIYNSLNLNYPIDNFDYSNQTNYLVSEIINNFIKKYKDNYEDKTFILILQNDIYSLISYYIIKAIKGLLPIDLKFIGKRNRLKQFLDNNLYLSPLKKYKLKKENIVYLSCYNPIYKVKKHSPLFKEISKENTVYLIDKFTPRQFQILSDFYNIRSFDLLEDLNKEDFKKLNDFCYNYYQDITFFENLEFNNKIKEIGLVYLEGNESDFNLFDEIRKKDEESIYFYFYNTDKKEYVKTNLNPFISPANSINDKNSNLSVKELAWIENNSNLDIKVYENKR